MFGTRPPTNTELQSLHENGIEITSEQPWDPRNISRPTTSTATRRRISAMAIGEDINDLKSMINISALRVCEQHEQDAALIEGIGNDNRFLSGVSTALLDETLLPRLVSEVNTSETASSNRHSDITPESLARKWRIGVPQAKLTLQRTTQQGIEE